MTNSSLRHALAGFIVLALTIAPVRADVCDEFRHTINAYIALDETAIYDDRDAALERQAGAFEVAANAASDAAVANIVNVAAFETAIEAANITITAANAGFSDAFRTALITQRASLEAIKAMEAGAYDADAALEVVNGGLEAFKAAGEAYKAANITMKTAHVAFFEVHYAAACR